MSIPAQRQGPSTAGLWRPGLPWALDLAASLTCPPVLQDLFSRQKGYLEEELDYRKQALDQAYLVGPEVGVTLWLFRLTVRGLLFPLQAGRAFGVLAGL